MINEVNGIGCRKQSKRKIVVKNAVFYWYIGKDPRDRCFAQVLHIVSHNKTFLAIYRLDYVSEGSLIDKLEIIKSNYRAPGFYEFHQHMVDNVVTPGLVREILNFCLIQNNE